MKLIGLLLLLPLLSLFSLVEGEVVASFAATCPDFFVEDQNNRPVTPTVLGGAQYKQICQKHKNIYRYATLYDTTNKIPVYSAYKHTGYKQTKPRTWMIEPQLDVPATVGPDEMTTESKAGGPVGTNQAVNGHYDKSGYDRGHLYPRCNNCVQDQEESTFTLTNAAPQKNADNRAWYRQVEKLQQNINQMCIQNTAYVVTGVIPGNNVIPQTRVHIPTHYWSAYCCADKNNQNQFISQGYTLQMTGMGNAQATYPTVAQLNTDLATKYNKRSFKVFGAIPGCS
ncbi:endonuclease domain-containing 1 protein-like [Alosa pseudoharengus]|uniref:endonuclease domain-containing 1 protein-like n=1 Tax=Alosa pseudoharengus TaxID=34774 RepID=UPI003F8BAACB